MMPLGLLSAGERAEIINIKSCRQIGGNACCGEGKRECHRTDEMGIRQGKKIEMLCNEGGGPILLKIDESRIAIGRGMAMKIIVRKIDLRKGGAD